MNLEIERRFLVVGESWRGGGSPLSCRQGYLSFDPQRVVRVRILGDKAYLAIKGIKKENVRLEFEFPLPQSEAEYLLQNLCHQPLIEKTRQILKVAGLTWEVDEFKAANQGLILTEVELEEEGQDFEKPDWVGREVSGDPRYLNVNLAQRPFSTWGEGE